MFSLSAGDFLDHRGRVNRKGLAITAAALAGMQGGLYAACALFVVPVDDGAALALNALIFWLSMAAVSKRLHDLDLSAWHAVGAIVLLLVWCFGLGLAIIMTLGEEAVQPGHAGMVFALVGAFAPLAAMLAWLHLMPGEKGSNRFGPAPGDLGFSRGHAGLAAPVVVAAQ